MSLLQMIERVRDESFTKEQATALVNERVAEMVTALGYTEDEARSRILANLGCMSNYYVPKIADRIMDLYGTEHPVFGREHPKTYAEVLKFLNLKPNGERIDHT